MTLLSIIIATYNSARTVRQTLSSIFSNDFPQNLFEVLVVDGGSVDGTVDIVKEFPVRIYSRPNSTVGFRRNIGIKKARGDITCCTDSDIIVPNDWLRKISDYFQKHPDVDGVGGPILPPAHGNLNEIQKFTGELYFEDQGFPTRITRIKTLEYKALIITGNSAFRKKTLVSVGGYEETIFSIDIDLMWRLVMNGRCLMFLPHLKVIHLGFPWTLPSVLKQQFKWGKNRAILRKMHPYKDNSFNSSLKRRAYPYYQITRAFLLLFLHPHQPMAKRLIRLSHYISFHLGRVYGRSLNPKNRQTCAQA